MKDIIIIKDAGFSYGAVPVFSGLDLSVRQGEVLCLFGPNGCGKTTLIDCVLGHLTLKSGAINIFGMEQRLYSNNELAKKIAYVPQTHQKTFPYSVRDVVVMGRTPHIPPLSSPSVIDFEIADAALNTIGISHLRNRIYTQISGGETQLVILARAIAQSSPVIMMDEPAAHLDFRHEFLFLETISRLVREQGLTIVMSTHSPNHAFHFENAGLPVRIALMNEGRFVETGTPGSVLNQSNMKMMFGLETRLLTHKKKGSREIKYITAAGQIEQDIL